MIMNNKHFSRLLDTAQLTSEDPDTQVGCVLVSADENDIIMSANKFTTGIIATDENSKRPEKYNWIEHAERNAIFNAAKHGIKLADATMYLPGFPCVECARSIAQSGIKKLFCGSVEGWDEERYKFKKSRIILEAAGVKLIEGWRD